MRLLELDIKNVRGLPEITLQPDGKSMVIWGPNGAGKSGVVDAIDFVLTGRISRLAGEGTAGITLTKHGPHIDHDAESAIVRAVVQIEGFSEPITLQRCMAAPGKLECPEEARLALDQVANIVRRGAVILTRRDILRYVTANAGTRADEIAELLNIQDIETVRASLVRARTELTRNEQNAQSAIDTARADVNVILQGDTFSDENLLRVINDCRKTLGGEAIAATQSAALMKGLTPPTVSSTQGPFNTDLFRKAIDNIRNDLRPEALAQVSKFDKHLRHLIAEIKEHAELLSELDHLELTQHAMRFVSEKTTECPVCGTSWPEGQIENRLKTKLVAGKEAETRQSAISKAAGPVASSTLSIQASVHTIMEMATGTKMGEALKDDIDILASWHDQIEKLLRSLKRPVDSYLEANIPSSEVERLLAPSALEALLGRLEVGATRESPTPTPQQTAWDTLTGFQATVPAIERRVLEKEATTLHRSRAEILVQEYEKARDSILNDLYTRIAGRFVELYCVLHEHERDHFGAHIQAEGPSLKFEVDFLGRGVHPPHALHSEGHQDSMGLCLFLALSEELAKGHTDLIVLDDVMMSVDTGHRKDVCRLLNEMFPDRQFLIMTHDKMWSRQLKQERVVEPSHAIEFTGWTVETGPRVHQQKEQWEAIANDLEREDIPEAAFKLRRGGEDFFESACDALGAKVTYNSATQWQLGDWLPAAMDEYKELLKKGRRAARSWGSSEILEKLDVLDSIRSQIYGRTYVEQWAINTSVHYNNWANMSSEDFSPVVDAFRDLQGLFSCSSCTGLIQALPSGGTPEVVKCPCGKIDWNLKQRAST